MRRHSSPADNYGSRQPHSGPAITFYAFMSGCTHLISHCRSKSTIRLLLTEVGIIQHESTVSNSHHYVCSRVLVDSTSKKCHCLMNRLKRVIPLSFCRPYNSNGRSRRFYYIVLIWNKIMTSMIMSLWYFWLVWKTTRKNLQPQCPNQTCCCIDSIRNWNLVAWIMKASPMFIKSVSR